MGAVGALAQRGNRLVAAAAFCGGFTGGCTEELSVFEISSPSTPRLVGKGGIVKDQTGYGGLPRSVAIAGTFAIVADEDDVHFVSIGNLNGNPMPFVTRTTPGEAMAVAVADDRFYIADGTNGFVAGDVRGLVHGSVGAVLESDAPTTGESRIDRALLRGNAVDVVIDDSIDRAYVADAEQGIVSVYDVSEVTPRWLSYFDVGSSPQALSLFAYRGSGTGTTEIDVFLKDYRDGVTVREGERIAYCFLLSDASWVRLWWFNPETGWNAYYEEYHDGGRVTCAWSDPLRGPGIRKIRGEALSGRGGSVVDSDETYFYVESAVEPAVEIEMEGGCGRTINWGERFSYSYRATVDGRVEVYDCWPESSDDSSDLVRQLHSTSWQSGLTLM
jgi:hypothetical protein